MEAWRAVEEAQSELPSMGGQIVQGLAIPGKSAGGFHKGGKTHTGDRAPRGSSGRAGCGRAGAFGPLQLRRFRKPYPEDLSGGVPTIPL